MEAERLGVTARGGEGRVGHCTLVKKKKERQTEEEREREREATGGEGCQLVWPAPGARGECSVQQTA